MKVSKKYQVLMIGIIVLGLGSTIATISLTSASNVGFENVVINSQPIAPSETQEGSFIINEDYDVKFFVNNYYGGKALEVKVTDDIGNQIFFQTNVQDDIEEIMNELKAGKYFVFVKNLDAEYARVHVIASPLDGKDLFGAFLSLAFLGIAGLVIMFAGSVIIIIGLVKFFQHKKKNERLASWK